jgi:flagellar hook-length control protein FliK
MIINSLFFKPDNPGPGGLSIKNKFSNSSYLFSDIIKIVGLKNDNLLNNAANIINNSNQLSTNLPITPENNNSCFTKLNLQEVNNIVTSILKQNGINTVDDPRNFQLLIDNINKLAANGKEFKINLILNNKNIHINISSETNAYNISDATILIKPSANNITSSSKNVNVISPVSVSSGKVDFTDASITMIADKKKVLKNTSDNELDFEKTEENKLSLPNKSTLPLYLTQNNVFLVIPHSELNNTTFLLNSPNDMPFYDNNCIDIKDNPGLSKFQDEHIETIPDGTQGNNDLLNPQKIDQTDPNNTTVIEMLDLADYYPSLNSLKVISSPEVTNKINFNTISNQLSNSTANTEPELSANPQNDSLRSIGKKNVDTGINIDLSESNISNNAEKLIYDTDLKRITGSGLQLNNSDNLFNIKIEITDNPCNQKADGLTVLNYTTNLAISASKVTTGEQFSNHSFFNKTEINSGTSKFNSEFENLGQIDYSFSQSESDSIDLNQTRYNVSYSSNKIPNLTTPDKEKFTKIDIDYNADILKTSIKTDSINQQFQSVVNSADVFQKNAPLEIKMSDRRNVKGQKIVVTDKAPNKTSNISRIIESNNIDKTLKRSFIKPDFENSTEKQENDMNFPLTPGTLIDKKTVEPVIVNNEIVNNDFSDIQHVNNNKTNNNDSRDSNLISVESTRSKGIVFNPDVTLQENSLKNTSNTAIRNMDSNMQNIAPAKVMTISGKDNVKIPVSLSGEPNQSDFLKVKAEDLVKEIHRVFTNDDSRKVVLNLQPENLGNVKIEFDIKEKSLNAKVSVDTESAKNLIQTNSETLKNALQESGITLNSFNVLLSEGHRHQHVPILKKKIQKNDIIESHAEPIQPKRRNLGYNTYEYLA